MDLEYRKEDYECIYFETFIQRFSCLLKNENGNMDMNSKKISSDPVTLLLEVLLKHQLETRRKEAGLGGDGRWREPSVSGTGQEAGSEEGKGKPGDLGSIGWRHNGKPTFIEGLLSLCQALFGP